MALRGTKLTAALRLYKSGLRISQVARLLGVRAIDLHKAIRKAL